MRTQCLYSYREKIKRQILTYTWQYKDSLNLQFIAMCLRVLFYKLLMIFLPNLKGNVSIEILFAKHDKKMFADMIIFIYKRQSFKRKSQYINMEYPRLSDNICYSDLLSFCKKGKISSKSLYIYIGRNVIRPL